jgi:hypothetical protein
LHNGFGLGEGGDFTANVHSENQTLINHKIVFGTRNPAFWVDAVIGWFLNLLMDNNSVFFASALSLIFKSQLDNYSA